jgi:hypothetical protein
LFGQRRRADEGEGGGTSQDDLFDFHGSLSQLLKYAR